MKCVLMLLVSFLVAACCGVGDVSCQTRADKEVESASDMPSDAANLDGQSSATVPSTGVVVRPETQVVVDPTAPECQRDANGKLRFKMTQNGKRMTASDFKAWMQRCGVGVASNPQPIRSAPVTPPNTGG